MNREDRIANTRALLVLPPDRRSKLQKLLNGCGIQTSLASTFGEARQKLAGSASYDLVLTDTEFPDGSWRSLLEFVLDSKAASEIIVSSRCGDEDLWAEVLQRGAYDLLVEPYEQQEVCRIVESALDSHHMLRITQMASARQLLQ